MKAEWTIACVCAATVALAAACSDETVVDATGGTGGTGAVEAGSGGAAGSSGGGSGGASGSGGGAGSGGVAGADGGAVTGVILAATTDYFSSTEVASIDLATQTVLGTFAVADGDAVVAASSGLGFVLARTSSEVLTLKSGAVDKTIDVGATAVGLTGTTPTNPSAIAALPASTKAYVTLYDANRVAVVNLASGTVSGTVDLSGYLGSGDGDGSVDATGAVLDETTGRVYFALERVDRSTVAPPAFELACPTDKALLLAIDSATDQLVDLNGAAAGEGIELGLTNPVDLAFDSAKGRLLILSAGCFAAGGDAGSQRTGFGVESVDLSSGQVQTLLSPAAPDFLSRLLLLGGDEAVIDRFDDTFAEHWSRWTLTASALGPDLADVPAAPTADQQGNLWGIAFTDVDGGTSPALVRYDSSTEKGTQVATWQSTLDSAASTALVR